MSSCFLPYIYEKEDNGQETDEAISDLPKIGQGEFLTIDRYPVCKEDNLFEKGIYMSIFYFLCFVEDISSNMAEKQMM